MLNLIAFDPELDKKHLQNSFESIKYKDCLEIVMSEAEKNTILLKIKFALTLPERATICFQNLFKLTLPNGHFYIGQCLLNFGFSASSVNNRFSNHDYQFQIVGIADTRVDLGKTLMRPETRIDKTVGRIFGNDIDLEDTKHFNDKYYLVSNTPGVIEKHFDKGFVNTISKYDNLLLMARDREICVTFDSKFEAQHARIVEDIFCNCKFLIPNYSM